jgi:hypothetical protein
MTAPAPAVLSTFLARITIALAFGCAVTVFAYSTVRIVDVLLFPEPNPAIVVWTDRSRFVWRALIAVYLGGASVFAGFGLVNRRPERSSVWLEWTVLAAATSLLGQAVFAP